MRDRALDRITIKFGMMLVIVFGLFFVAMHLWPPAHSEPSTGTATTLARMPVWRRTALRPIVCAAIATSWRYGRRRGRARPSVRESAPGE
jgi:hypothetical protein